MSRRVQEFAILDAKKATGKGNNVYIKDHRHKNIVIATSGMGTGDSIVVKCQGACTENCPDFGAAQAVTNMWDYVQMIDLQSGSAVNGDTGVSFADADDCKQFAVNIDGLSWLTLNVTTISDTTNSSVTAKIALYNDSNN